MVAQTFEDQAVENGVAEGAGKVLEAALVVGAVVVLASSIALAGNDATFQEADNFVSNFLSGTGGKTIGGVALATAVINAVAGFNWKFFGSAVAIGLACGIGPNVMNTFFTGVF